MKFSAQEAIFWCEQLLAIAVLLQSFELLFLRGQIRKIWNAEILPATLLKISGCIGLFISPDPIFHLSILMGTLLTARTFGGTFNGGSDMMTFHVLLATTLARLFPQAEPATFFALGYLAVQLVASYFLAGIAKLRQKNWRTGQALKNILNASFYSVPESAKNYVPPRVLSWVTISFEVLFPLALLNTTSAMVFIAIAILFHFGNFWVLGLNRFVFAWIAAYPAMIWLSGVR